MLSQNTSSLFAKSLVSVQQSWESLELSLIIETILFVAKTFRDATFHKVVSHSVESFGARYRF